jgi:hypothetical protein
MLMRDAGTQLSELIRDPPNASVWSGLLTLYAELQIELVDSVEELLVLGTPDKRLRTLPKVYEGLLSRWPGGKRVPSSAQIVALVDGLGDTIPESLTHEEFQDHNVLLRDGSPVVIDWAEAAVEQPFCGSSIPFAAWSIAGDSSRERTGSCASETPISNPGRASHRCPA